MNIDTLVRGSPPGATRRSCDKLSGSGQHVGPHLPCRGARTRLAQPTADCESAIAPSHASRRWKARARSPAQSRMAAPASTWQPFLPAGASAAQGLLWRLLARQPKMVAYRRRSQSPHHPQRHAQGSKQWATRLTTTQSLSARRAAASLEGSAQAQAAILRDAAQERGSSEPD